MSAFESFVLDAGAFIKREFFKILIAIAVLIVLVVPAVVFFTTQKKEPVKTPEVQEQQVALSTDAMLSAMIRAWDGKRFLKVCYDAPTKNGKYGFFVEYGPKTDPDDKTLAEGWWYVEQQFFMTSAGKIYTNDIPNLQDDWHVYPDVSGLACKDK